MLRIFIMDTSPIEMKIGVTPYTPVWLPHVTSLISKNDMECTISTLPEFGVVAFEQRTDDLNRKHRDIVVGYIGAHRRYESAAFIDIYVVEKICRAKGIGTALVLELMEMFAKCGITKYSATVDTFNTKALAFYETLGCPMVLKHEINDEVSRLLPVLRQRPQG
jgi:GNAT superfamily N-acetyltransferase